MFKYGQLIFIDFLENIAYNKVERKFNAQGLTYPCYVNKEHSPLDCAANVKKSLQPYRHRGWNLPGKVAK